MQHGGVERQGNSFCSYLTAQLAWQGRAKPFGQDGLSTDKGQMPSPRDKGRVALLCWVGVLDAEFGDGGDGFFDLGLCVGG